MRPIRYIILHCSDTPTGRETTVADIDAWHIARGFNRLEHNRLAFNPALKAIGYHFVVYLDGSIHTGRQVAEIGAHCAGCNSDSIGICLVGRGVFTAAQWSALAELVRQLQITYPHTVIKGHYETDTGRAQGKSCPGFPVQAWIHDKAPLEVNIA